MELHRSESEKKQEADFLMLLEQGRTLAEQLENLLQSDRAKDPAPRVSIADSIMKQLSNNCSQCHRQYRDNR
jgi:mono/diheme cytochrome c family protein